MPPPICWVRPLQVMAGKFIPTVKEVVYDRRKEIFLQEHTHCG
jgi:hypothetical protein